MVDDQPEFRLENLTWREAEERFESADFVALPCGATEQHATHLPVSVDTIRAEELTDELARAAPDHDLELLVLPALDYGYSEHHMNFAGTITLGPETYRRLVVEIGQCVKRHGARRFLLCNYHAGNRSTLGLAADRLQRDHDLQTHLVGWSDFASDALDEAFDAWGHSGPHETSLIEYYRPELVHTDEKRPPTTRPRFETRPYRYIDEITDEGAITDPTPADPSVIEPVIADTTYRILEALRADIERDA